MIDVIATYGLDKAHTRPLAVANFDFVSGKFPFSYRIYKKTPMTCNDVLEKIGALLGLSPSMVMMRSRTAREVMYSLDEANIIVDLSEGSEYLSFAILIYAKTEASAKALFDSLSEEGLIIPYESKDEGIVLVDFWHQTSQGAEAYQRRIAVPKWEDISPNYSEETRVYVEKILARDKSSITGAGGKLIIWRGEPGLGKTFAIRALLAEWKGWCRGHYVTDPERFLNDSQYLMKVLLDEDDDEDDDDGGRDYDHLGSTVYGTSDQKLKLIILEDAGELLTEDAKRVNGQAMQRLLNVTEGMIGQGLQVLILLTTNEDIDKFDPALTRSGRCLQNIEFSRLSSEEATKWCADNGLVIPDREFGKTIRLSDLFALRDGLMGWDEVSGVRRKAGFSIPSR